MSNHQSDDLPIAAFGYNIGSLDGWSAQRMVEIDHHRLSQNAPTVANERSIAEAGAYRSE